MNLRDIVQHALEEDTGSGDITSEAVVPADLQWTARVIAKQDLVVCGHEVAEEVFRQVGVSYTVVVPEGQRVPPGTIVARTAGSARALLRGERIALNFLMRLCGIATHTANTVALAGDRLKVVDTRKTTPLLRALERRAVRIGGGANHRFALYDGVLIKDNHIRAAGGSIAEAVRRARAHAHHLVRIEVEVSSLAQLQEALDAGVEVVLLDNMDDDMLAQAVALSQGRALLEASGNMTAARLPRLAEIGIDIVSIGGLIHQATWADLSMKFD